MGEPAVIAVDWSGARRPRGLWLAVVREGELAESRALSTREQAVEYVLSLPPPVLAGFDFSFGLPEWFAREHGCAAIEHVWSLAARDGERWLAPTPPFWRDHCALARERRFRRCETRYPPAKSIFQLVGNGQVGAGSVRGMPLLARLRTAGVAVWPFDAPRERTVVEIYPSLLRRLAPHHDTGGWESNDERDAVVSARVMWDHRASVAALEAATDPVTRLEGDVWTPSAPGATAWP